MKRFNYDYVSYLLFFSISILILWNLLLPGYVLTLDMVFSDKSQLRNYISAFQDPNPSILLHTAIFISSLLMPMWIIQKIILFSIIFFSGVFAYNLCPSDNKIGKFFAGLIYMINPFIFVRFLAGHLLLLIGYAFLPLLVNTFMRFFEKPTTERIIKTTLILTLASIFRHFIPVIFGIFFLFFIVHLFRKNISKFLKPFGIVLMLYFLINSYWILSWVINKDAYMITFQRWVGPEDLDIFKSKSSLDFNTFFNLASMHGFWRQGYDYAKIHINLWYLLFFLILFLSVHGFLILNKNKKYSAYAKILVASAIISLILATGTTHPIFSKMFNFFFENIPFFKGYREPQKFIAILCLFYSFFGGVGLGDFVKQFQKSKNKSRYFLAAFVVLSLLTPIVYSYTMFFGFYGQLESVKYPKTWYDVDEYLREDKEDFNILFLPWHAYMDFKFSSRQRLANPAADFFSKPVIQGDNIEAGGIYSRSLNPISKYIEYMLFSRDRIKNFGKTVSVLNVKYIILAKDTDWMQYGFLKNQTDLELVVDNEDVLVFKNKHNTSKIYETDKILTKDDWSKLINDDSLLNIKSVKSDKLLFNYIIKEKPSKKYLIFTEVLSNIWSYDNQKPKAYLDTLNLFDSSDDNVIRYKEFSYFLIRYIISATTFLILIIVLIKPKLKKIKRPFI